MMQIPVRYLMQLLRFFVSNLSVFVWWLPSIRSVCACLLEFHLVCVRLLTLSFIMFLMWLSGTRLHTKLLLTVPALASSSRAVARMFYWGGSVCKRSESATRGSFWAAKRLHYAAAGEHFLGLTASKTSRCNLAIEISFVPSSQSTFNFSVLRGTQLLGRQNAKIWSSHLTPWIFKFRL